jgi:hypothetical protein
MTKETIDPVGIDQSPDPAAQRRAQLAALIPEAFSEGQLDVSALKRALGGEALIGSMNYFVVNSNASHIGEGRIVEPTTWRLLWKDDRYLDGTIPAEEAGYVFNEPS